MMVHLLKLFICKCLRQTVKDFDEEHMIKEYFKVIALVQECQREYDNLSKQQQALSDQIIAKYQTYSMDDVLVKVEDQYYLIGSMGIRLINLVESQDV